MHVGIVCAPLCMRVRERDIIIPLTRTLRIYGVQGSQMYLLLYGYILTILESSPGGLDNCFLYVEIQ